MGGRHPVKYDFLQVTDELIDQRAPALARLLTAGGRRTTEAEALRMLLVLERWVLRQVDDEQPDLVAEIRTVSTFPKDRAPRLLSAATGWPVGKAPMLLEALTDMEVRALEVVPEGWRVRGIAERYGRFVHERRASRERTRDNARARAAGWEPSEGKAWAHRSTGEELPSLREVIARLDEAPGMDRSPPIRLAKPGAR